MWSVTEQNHLHYPGVMFHRFRLVHWWPPTSLPLPLFFCCSASLSPVNAWLRTAARHPAFFFQSIFPADFSFISPSVHPSSSTSIFLRGVRTLLHHLSLVYLHSYFLFSFCFALRCCHLSALASPAALVLFVHLLYNFVGPNHSCSLQFSLSSDLFRSVASWGVSAVFEVTEPGQQDVSWYLKEFLIDPCWKILYFPCQ